MPKTPHHKQRSWEDLLEDLKRRISFEDVAHRLGFDPSKRHDCPCPDRSKSGTRFRCDGGYGHCNSCGDSFDIFALVGEVEGLGRAANREVVERTCELVGHPSPFERYHSQEEIERYTRYRSEQEAIQAVLTEAVRFWTENTPIEIRDFIEEKWGLSHEFQIAHGISYAWGSRLWAHLNSAKLERPHDEQHLRASGLFLGRGSSEYFQGRIIWPYWERKRKWDPEKSAEGQLGQGRVVYMIGRRVDGLSKQLDTPTNDYEHGKYKKLRRWNEGKSKHISQTIKEPIFNGADVRPDPEFTVGGRTALIITEGIADAYTAMQRGIPVVSPVTTRFKKQHAEDLKQAVSRFDLPVIANDNEENRAGEKGARATIAGFLAQGLDPRMIVLPRKEGVEKVDLCDWLKKKDKDELLRLTKRARPGVLVLASGVDCTLQPLDRIRQLEASGAFAWLTYQNNLVREAYLEEIKHTLGLKKIQLLRHALKDAKSDDSIPFERMDPQTLAQNEIAAYFIEQEGLKGWRWDPDAGVWMRYTKSGAWRERIPDRIHAAIIEFCGEIGRKKLSDRGVLGVEFFLKKALQETRWNWRDGFVPFSNGVLELATGELHPHVPHNYYSWVLPYPYEPQAQVRHIKGYLRQMFGGDESQVQIIRAFLAALIRGETQIQKWIEIVGDGGSGKSTLQRLAVQLVGEENTTTSKVKRLEKNRFEMARIVGKRLLLLSEDTEYNGNLAVLKQISGGDRVAVEQKNQRISGKGYKPQCLILFCANDKLKGKDEGGSLHRRRIVLECNNVPDTIADEREINRLFLSEMPGLINWCLELSRADIKSILGGALGNEAVRASTLDTILESNPLAAWMDARLIYDPSASTRIGARRKRSITEKGEATNETRQVILDAEHFLFPSYLDFCEKSGRKGGSSKQNFSKEVLSFCRSVLKLDGVYKHKTSRGMVIRGLRIRNDKDADTPSPVTLGAQNWTKVRPTDSDAVFGHWAHLADAGPQAPKPKPKPEPVIEEPLPTHTEETGLLEQSDPEPIQPVQEALRLEPPQRDEVEEQAQWEAAIRVVQEVIADHDCVTWPPINLPGIAAQFSGVSVAGLQRVAQELVEEKRNRGKPPDKGRERRAEE